MNRPSPSLHREAEKTLTLMQVAMGNHPAHMALTNANVLNVYTGELLENLTICTFESWIAYVGKEPGHAIGDHTEVIDLEGKTVVPGIHRRPRPSCLAFVTGGLSHIRGIRRNHHHHHRDHGALSGGRAQWGQGFPGCFEGPAHKNPGHGAGHGLDQQGRQGYLEERISMSS